MAKERVFYIDFLRGLAMILVVLGHSSSMDILNMCILSFHMPLFFFVSGLTFCVKGGWIFYLAS